MVDSRTLLHRARQLRQPAVLRMAVDRGISLAAQRALEPVDPAPRILSRAMRTFATPPFAVVSVYRNRHADTVLQLLSGLPEGTRAALWALDEADPRLAAQTVGSGSGLRFALLNDLLATLRPVEGEWLVVSDDDVRFAGGSGLADAVRAAAFCGLDLSTPTHRLGSPHVWDHNRHRVLTFARLNRFVEIGP